MVCGAGGVAVLRIEVQEVTQVAIAIKAIIVFAFIILFVYMVIHFIWF